MTPREERIKHGLPQIKRNLKEWGFNSLIAPSWYEKARHILTWLYNFQPSEIDDAFLLLDKIQYQDDNVIREAISILSQELISILGGSIQRSLFFPLGLSPSSSGGMYLYDFRKELKLHERQFSVWPLSEVNTDIEALVFFDDIIGSGKQAIRFFHEHITGVRQPVIYVSIFAFQYGLDRVRADGCFQKVISGLIFADEERAFGEDSMVFQDATQRLRIKSLAEKYGRVLYPSHPLGYDDTQSLLVFPHNTPNNTLPIIWASSNNEKEPGVVWQPLWERRKTSAAAAKPAASIVLEHGTPESSTPEETSFFFRDIQHRRWQEIPFTERPHPFPPINKKPPPLFELKPSGEVDYIAGWNIRLQAGVRYRLTYDFGTNDAWQEIEIVLYQRRVPGMNQGGELWKRAFSAGAVTSVERASDITPQSEDWLITCWGKTVIAWDAPWWDFVPESYALDSKNAVLSLSFADPDSQDGEGGLSTFPPMAGSRSVLYMKAVN